MFIISFIILILYTAGTPTPVHLQNNNTDRALMKKLKYTNFYVTLSNAIPVFKYLYTKRHGIIAIQYFTVICLNNQSVYSIKIKVETKL